MNSARIISRGEKRLSQWVTVVEKDVEFSTGAPKETYHCLSQSHYVAALARTKSGLFPIVKQYRPAVEDYTLEFPAGLVEKGEDPEKCCVRELKEETGLIADSVTYLGSFYADTGRLENNIYTYFVSTFEPDASFIAEPGMDVEYVDYEALKKLILLGKFKHQLHIGLLTMAQLKNLL